MRIVCTQPGVGCFRFAVFNGAVKDVLDRASGIDEIFCTVICSHRHIVPKLLDGGMDQAVWPRTSRPAQTSGFTVRGEQYAVGRVANRSGQEANVT